MALTAVEPVQLSARNKSFLRRAQADERPVTRRVLTAAATPLDLTNKVEARKLRVLRQGWQSDAAAYVKAVPELSFAYRFLANASARMRLYPALVNPDEPGGPPIPAEEHPKAPDGLVDSMQQAMASIGVGRVAVAPLMEALAYGFGVPGECFLVGSQDEIGTGDVWKIRSIEEFMVFDDSYKLREVPLDPQGVLGWTDLDPDTTYASRLWVPDFMFSKMATSPMRALLDTAEELLLLSRDVRAIARSRLAGGGILKIPEGLRLQTLIDDNEDPEAEDWFGRFAEAMMAPLADEGTASAIVPLAISGDPDSLHGLEHILIERPYSALAIELRAEAIGRLATGLDFPREILEGIGDVNHWSGALVSDETFRHHIEPQVIRQVDALSLAYLRTWLTAAGWEPYWVQRACVWYNPVDLIAKPDPMGNAVPLFDRYAISYAALREAGGYNDDDAPTTLEIYERQLAHLRTFPPNILEAIIHAVDPSLVIPPMQGTGNVQGMGPEGMPPGEGGPSPSPPPSPPPNPPSSTGISPGPQGPPKPGGPLPSQATPQNAGGPPKPAAAESPPTAPGLTERGTMALAARDRPVKKPPHPVPRQTRARLAERLSNNDAVLRARLQAAASAAVIRLLDRAGAKLRTRVNDRRFKDERVRTLTSSTENRVLAAALGEPIVAALGYSDTATLLNPDWGDLRVQFYEWVTATQASAMRLGCAIAGIDPSHPSAKTAAATFANSVEPAWQNLQQQLTGLAQNLIYNPDPNAAETLTINPSTIVPPGLIRTALTIAGGGRPNALTAAGQESLLDPGQTIDVSNPVPPGTDPDPAMISLPVMPPPDGMIGNSAALTAMFGDSSLTPASFTWEHQGVSPRPFEPHLSLDGVTFTSFTDDVLHNDNGWPENEYFLPGDHEGCGCDYSTEWLTDEEAAADGGDTEGDTSLDQTVDDGMSADEADQEEADQEAPAFGEGGAWPSDWGTLQPTGEDAFAPATPDELAAQYPGYSQLPSDLQTYLGQFAQNPNTGEVAPVSLIKNFLNQGAKADTFNLVKSMLGKWAQPLVDHQDMLSPIKPPGGVYIGNLTKGTEGVLHSYVKGDISASEFGQLAGLTKKQVSDVILHQGADLRAYADGDLSYPDLAGKYGEHAAQVWHNLLHPPVTQDLLHPPKLVPGTKIPIPAGKEPLPLNVQDLINKNNIKAKEALHQYDTGEISKTRLVQNIKDMTGQSDAEAQQTANDLISNMDAAMKYQPGAAAVIAPPPGVLASDWDLLTQAEKILVNNYAHGAIPKSALGNQPGMVQGIIDAIDTAKGVAVKPISEFAPGAYPKPSPWIDDMNWQSLWPDEQENLTKYLNKQMTMKDLEGVYGKQKATELITKLLPTGKPPALVPDLSKLPPGTQDFYNAHPDEVKAILNDVEVGNYAKVHALKQLKDMGANTNQAAGLVNNLKDVLHPPEPLVPGEAPLIPPDQVVPGVWGIWKDDWDVLSASEQSALTGFTNGSMTYNMMIQQLGKDHAEKLIQLLHAHDVPGGAVPKLPTFTAGRDRLESLWGTLTPDTSNYDVVATFNRAFQDQRDTLGAANQDVLSRYTGSTYYDINTGLRLNAQGIAPSRNTAKLISDLDGAFQQGASYMSEPETLWRGVARNSNQTTIDFFKQIDNLKVGDTFQEDGFMSTSATRPIADGFGRKGGGVVFQIEAPQGQPYLVASTYESELLLPRGTIFKVKDISEAATGSGGTYTRMIVDIIPPKGFVAPATAPESTLPDDVQAFIDAHPQMAGSDGIMQKYLSGDLEKGDLPNIVKGLGGNDVMSVKLMQNAEAIAANAPVPAAPAVVPSAAPTLAEKTAQTAITDWMKNPDPTGETLFDDVGFTKILNQYKNGQATFGQLDDFIQNASGPEGAPPGMTNLIALYKDSILSGEFAPAEPNLGMVPGLDLTNLKPAEQDFVNAHLAEIKNVVDQYDNGQISKANAIATISKIGDGTTKVAAKNIFGTDLEIKLVPDTIATPVPEAAPTVAKGVFGGVLSAPAQAVVEADPQAVKVALEAMGPGNLSPADVAQYLNTTPQVGQELVDHQSSILDQLKEYGLGQANVNVGQQPPPQQGQPPPTPTLPTQVADFVTNNSAAVHAGLKAVEEGEIAVSELAGKLNIGLDLAEALVQHASTILGLPPGL